MALMLGHVLSNAKMISIASTATTTLSLVARSSGTGEHRLHDHFLSQTLNLVLGRVHKPLNL